MAARPVPYVTTLPWTLASDLGPETVYVQFRSVAGTAVGNTQASIDLVFPNSQISSSSTASLIALIASLQAQLAALLKQVGQAPTASTSISFVFTRALFFGMTGNDVTHL